jgi:DNA-binding response OmpR family regulator
MGASFRVVLIDDDPDLLKLTRLTLELTAGWEVTPAADGAAGIEAARSVKPDVVVADLMMPQMDGYEVCRRLKAEADTAAVPVVLMTARRELDEAKLRQVGAAGVVFKPFEPDELAPRIRELAEGGQ